jgi:hypothetical protein
MLFSHVLIEFSTFILSHGCVTIDGVWINYWIYWTLIQLVTTLHITITHKLVFSVKAQLDGARLFERRDVTCSANRSARLVE